MSPPGRFGKTSRSAVIVLLLAASSCHRRGFCEGSSVDSVRRGLLAHRREGMGDFYLREGAGAREEEGGVEDRKNDTSAATMTTTAAAVPPATASSSSSVGDEYSARGGPDDDDDREGLSAGPHQAYLRRSPVLRFAEWTPRPDLPAWCYDFGLCGCAPNDGLCDVYDWTLDSTMMEQCPPPDVLDQVCPQDPTVPCDDAKTIEFCELFAGDVEPPTCEPDEECCASGGVTSVTFKVVDLDGCTPTPGSVDSLEDSDVVTVLSGGRVLVEIVDRITREPGPNALVMKSSCDANPDPKDDFHISCSENILGEERAGLRVVAYTGGKNEDEKSCRLRGPAPASTTPPPGRRRRMTETTTTHSCCYGGGITEIVFRNTAGCTNIESLEGSDVIVKNGDYVTVTIDERIKREPKPNQLVLRSSCDADNAEDFHISCSENILGEEHAGLRVVEYTGGKNEDEVTCSIDDTTTTSSPLPPPEPCIDQCADFVKSCCPRTCKNLCCPGHNYDVDECCDDDATHIEFYCATPPPLPDTSSPTQTPTASPTTTRPTTMTPTTMRPTTWAPTKNPTTANTCVNPRKRPSGQSCRRGSQCCSNVCHQRQCE